MAENNLPSAAASSVPPLAPAAPQRRSRSANPHSSSSALPPPSVLGDVLSVLTSFHRNHERVKLLRVSLSLIRFLSILNLVYTLLGITLLVMALCTKLAPDFNEYQRNQFYKIGLTVSVFAPLATFVDLFALRGLQQWRRGHLLPWLAVYGFLLLLFSSHAITGVVHYGFKWTYFVLLLCAFCLYSSWRHIFRQYYDMSRDRPSPSSLDQLANHMERSSAAAAANNLSPENDLPPKYEDLTTTTSAGGVGSGNDNLDGAAAAVVSSPSRGAAAAVNGCNNGDNNNDDDSSSSSPPVYCDEMAVEAQRQGVDLGGGTAVGGEGEGKRITMQASLTPIAEIKITDEVQKQDKNKKIDEGDSMSA